MATKLSDHFTLEELTTTQQRGMDNTPGEVETANLTTLAKDCLEKVREQVGPMHINSGFRSIEVNEAVGGQPTSQHCHGQAADFTPLTEGMTLKAAMKKILDSGLAFDQLLYEYGRWIHISFDPKRLRKQVLMIGSFTNNRWTQYDPAKIP